MASQSSLEIILENSPHDLTTRHCSFSRPEQFIRNRNEYESISNDEDNDDRGDRMEYDDGDDADADQSTSLASKSGQGWRNVRAVMAYYCTLRKIKRHGALILINNFSL